MTTTQKILLVAAGALGFLVLANRTRANASEIRQSTGAGTRTVTEPSTGSRRTESTPDVPAPPTWSPDFSLYFATGSASISDPVKMNSWIASLRAERAANNLNNLEIHGYSSPSGSASANLALSQRRVDAVADILAAVGVPVVGYAHGEITGSSAEQAQRVDVYAM
jgi:outer membrane protein OmpA-like peptidoglycan-associated protein